MEGARLGTLEQTRFNAREANAKTRAAMVGVNLQTMPKHNFFGDFTTGALTAAPIGMELSKLMSSDVFNTLNEGADVINNDQLDDSGMYDNLANTGPAWNTNIVGQFKPTIRGY